MSHSRTHEHTAKPPRTRRQTDQRRLAQQRREAEALRDRYADDEQVPGPEDSRDHHLDGPRYRP